MTAQPSKGRDGGREAVLGIDAAWTATNPSGVALAAHRNGRWRLVAAAASYSAYQEIAGGGHLPDAVALLAATQRLCGQAPSLVAVDMPLARTPIISRRASDNAVSRAYGARHGSTHTPSALRPGPISDRLTAAFADAGYPLVTDCIAGPGLIEVYPHPALIELAQESRRLPYKISNAGKYWPDLSPRDRRETLIGVWRRIVGLLEREIEGVAVQLALPDLASPVRELKAYEDKLDAVVCAWVGVCALEGRALPYGDEMSAIWIPTAQPLPMETV